MATVNYCSQADLEDALGLQIVRSAYDDDADGVADPRPIKACLDYATAECDSYLVGRYEGVFPITVKANVPAELKFAAVDFACAYTARRRPDLMRAASEQPWTVFYESAMKKMERYRAAIERLPVTTGTPLNEGATVTADDASVQEAIDAGDITTQQHWGDMGDF
jgi:phage gp36-like protein